MSSFVTQTLIRLRNVALPVGISLAITAGLILIVDADPLAVFENVWRGIFRDSRTLAQVVNFWLPLTLVSTGLIVTFRGGLWNIGVEGQMMMGAVFATWGALTLDLPHHLLVPVEILLAAAGGAAWAALAGVLKIRFGVHEIFGGVALNALGNVISIYLISGPWQPPEGGSVRATPQFAQEALLPPMSQDFPVSLLMLLIVAAAFALTAFALQRTRWGLQLKATGKNPRSALLLGVPTDRIALSGFIVCGALAGIAGAYRVLFTYGSLRPLVSGGIGFLGLLVVLLASFSIVWVPLVTIAFAAILAGSTRLRIALQLDASLAGVLQSVLVLTMLLTNGFRQRLQALRSRSPARISDDLSGQK